ncbi:MAG: rhodanese-related sulfurtransferase [Pseudomonadota bacterium]
MTSIAPDRDVQPVARFDVAALYCFAPMPEPAEQRATLQALCDANDVLGTLLVADEGINGTIAGNRAGLDAVIGYVRAIPGFGDLDVKWSRAVKQPFVRMKARLKREIVTMGVDGIDPNATVGTYVAPEDWNALIQDPNVVLVDTRNDYEVAIGTFEGAVDPNTKSFRDFPDWAEQNLSPKAGQKIAMFCTGGIRCEKATALLKSRGFEDVYHLQGGILRYLETVPADESLWQGECFVFDQRVSVGAELKPGPYQLCATCRQPFLSGAGAGGYARGLCEACEATASDAQKRRAAERTKQLDLAKARGQVHIGRKA